MTTIAFRAGVLAADTLSSEGRERFGFGSKIGVARDEQGHAYGYAAAGDTGLCQRFKKWAAAGMVGDPPAMKSGSAEAVGYVLRAHHFTAYEAEVPPFDLAMHTDADGVSFCSFGSGSSYALGALARGATSSEAVAVAMRFDTCTGGDVTVLYIDGAQR